MLVSGILTLSRYYSFGEGGDCFCNELEQLSQEFATHNITVGAVWAAVSAYEKHRSTPIRDYLRAQLLSGL